MPGIAECNAADKTHPFALLCDEKEPLGCDRRLLIRLHLEAQGFALQHMLPDGREKTLSDQTMSDSDRLEMSCDKRGQEIEYGLESKGGTDE